MVMRTNEREVEMMDVGKYLEECYPEDEDLIVFNGLDDAFLGVVYSFTTPITTCYDKEKIITILMDRDCMTYEEAIEFFDFNIAGLYAGERTPFILEKVEYD
jgi:hypothetical protein